jgi:hypothetical protein
MTGHAGKGCSSEMFKGLAELRKDYFYQMKTSIKNTIILFITKLLKCCKISWHVRPSKPIGPSLTFACKDSA